MKNKIREACTALFGLVPKGVLHDSRPSLAPPGSVAPAAGVDADDMMPPLPFLFHDDPVQDYLEAKVRFARSVLASFEGDRP